MSLGKRKLSAILWGDREGHKGVDIIFLPNGPVITLNPEDASELCKELSLVEDLYNAREPNPS